MLSMPLNPVLRIAVSPFMHGRLLFGHETLPVKVQPCFWQLVLPLYLF